MKSKKTTMVKWKRRDFIIAGLGLGALCTMARYSYLLGGLELFKHYMAALILVIGVCMLGRGLRNWRLSRKATIKEEERRE